MSPAITEKQILDALRNIEDPDLRKDLVSLGFVQNVKISGGAVSFDIVLTTPACPARNTFKSEAERLVGALPGVTKVTVNLRSNVKAQPAIDKKAVAGIKNIIAIGSGKGGVGKSTVAANIAAGLASLGTRTGLLDADIYGPSMPFMMGRELSVTGRGETIIPATAHGVKIMSMGFIVPGDKPLIWRGPMAHKAMEQSLLQVEWGDLDYLIVDLPPGTGDVHLTLVQTVSLAGAVLVSTPQDVGLTISLKTLRLFEQSNVRMLGLIENMSGYVCPKCGHEDEIFGKGTVETRAAELKIPFLGRIPINAKIREHADSGVPVIIAEPGSPSALAYSKIVENLAAQVSVAGYRK